MANIRGASSLNIRVEGLEQLQSQFERLGKIPKKYLTKSAKAGMADVERQAKANAPEGKTGNLKKSIKKKMETPNKRRKAVYRLQHNPAMADLFIKPSSGAYGGTPPSAYYPTSVEFGFKTKKGKVAGQFNMARAIQMHQQSSAQKIVNSLNQSISTLLGNG